MISDKNFLNIAKELSFASKCVSKQVRLLCEKHGGSLKIENAGGGKVTASFGNILSI